MTSPHQFAPRCRAKRRGDHQGRRRWPLCDHVQESMLACPNGVRQYMRAGRPYGLSHGGNVAAGRRAKTPNVNGGTPSPATRDHPL
ncbi:hypothetical protein F9U41_13760 [Pectobacterium versatile]|nr:hypothetical protein [Pectobacterium versatile]